MTKQPQRKPLQPTQNLHKIPNPQILQMRVLGPRADGEPELVVRDAVEPAVGAHPALEAGAGARLAARPARGLEERVDPGEGV